LSDQPTLRQAQDATPLELAAASLDAPAGAWLDAYLDLKAAGLTWKRAAFAAWVNAPKSARQPRTMKELAALLNLKSEQIFYRWQQEAWFRDSGIDKLRQMIFQKFVADIDRKTIHAAMVEDGSPGVAARRLFYEQAKLAQPGAGTDDSPFTIKVVYGERGNNSSSQSAPETDSGG